MVNTTISDAREEVFIECSFQQMITTQTRVQRVAAADRLRLGVMRRSAAQVYAMEQRKGLLHER